MRRFLAVLVLSGCLFPSLDDLHSTDGGSDGAVDVVPPLDAADVTQPTPDASDGGGCPPNADPTLLAYYRFDEGSGTIVHDCSGNGFDGLILAQPDGGSWTQGHRAERSTSMAPRGASRSARLRSSCSRRRSPRRRGST